MSRFTRPPFHKPSPFDIPRAVHPLSPPETENTADSITLPPMSIVSRDIGSYADMGASSSFTRVDAPESFHASPMDTQTPTKQFRRPSNLAYLHPGSLRSDLRSGPRSATRWLVMVIPPPPVGREHSSGAFLNASAHSSQSQGVLLPLLPSLSGQLSAIAREFSFPSTTGICIFLQMLEGGVQFSPRVSDESWPILWGAAFDERQTMTTMGGLPIVGRIEFDLDLRKARWFDMWLTSAKHGVELGPSIPASLSANHRRSESRTTFDHTEDSAGDDISVAIQRKVPVVRHVPRKLSLLDRIDVSTIKPISRAPSRIALSPTDAEQPRVMLSPVAHTPIAVTIAVEDNGPPTAIRRVDVERKVENWRASSTFAKSPLVASTGQTALDPANMPNNQPLVDSDIVAADAHEPLNLDDYTWSISSAGPQSADFRIPIPLYAEIDRPPSVHLDGRLEGSVLLTPTTCTSWGPPDYDVFSPVASLIDRLPSPDIASRQFEDAPPTPTTATSWGAPSEWPDSPAVLSRAPSVDIAARHFESRPVTPSTATSWGAPSEWPDSPALSFRAPSVDLATRQLGSRPATPSTATSWGAPLEWPASPASPFYVGTPGVGSMFFDGQEEENVLLERGRTLRSYGAGDEEPHRKLMKGDDAGSVSRPWRFVWPYRSVSPPNDRQPISVHVKTGYPCISLYPAVYPHFDLYPSLPMSHVSMDEKPPKRHGSLSRAALAHVTTTKPWNHVWPYQKIVNNVVGPINVRLESVYPSIELYPAVYPCFDLYPLRPLLTGTTRGVNVRLEPRYPTLSIYAAIYPTFEIYPGHVIEAQSNQRKSITVRLQSVYPCIQLYSAVYPHFDLYPTSTEVKSKGRRQPPRKRDLPLHAGIAQSKKASPWSHVWPYQHVSDIGRRPVNTRLESVYPSFDLYPAVYPHFDLYPVKALALGRSREINVKLETKYPVFSIYPAVYPNFEVYPGHVSKAQKNQRELLSMKLASSYPCLEIYPAVYPHLVIYPGHAIEGKERSERTSSNRLPVIRNSAQRITKQLKDARPCISVSLHSTYPNLEIYPPVYPNLRVYPPVASLPLVKVVSTVCEARYPNFDIYPAVYPYFDIYRSGKAWTPESLREARVALDANYPIMEIYPPVYPFFDIYKSGHVVDITPFASELSTKLKAKYPAFDIYPAVYPIIELYPSAHLIIESQRRRPRKTHQELVDIVSVQSARIRARIVPRISISSHAMRKRPRRTHAQLVELAFSKLDAGASRPRRSADVPLDVGDESPVTPQTRRPSGIPTRPTNRRSLSLAQATMSSLPGIARSTSLRQPSSVREDGIARSSSLRQLPSVREDGVATRVRVQRPGHDVERKSSSRDSIVLERARHWGVSNSTPPRAAPHADNASRMTMKDLSEFPMPPLPPVPTLPNGRPASAINRPIAKLDKTKFPFR